MEPRTAYQLIHDELALDANPALNLATFVTTFMDEQADPTQRFAESLRGCTEAPDRWHGRFIVKGKRYASAPGDVAGIKSRVRQDRVFRVYQETRSSRMKRESDMRTCSSMINWEEFGRSQLARTLLNFSQLG